MITCFNRDKKGFCLAYNEGKCREDCPARIKTIEDKINLLVCLLARAQAKKEMRSLNEELEAAHQFKAAQDSGKFESWMSCYLDDLHRGEKGGASESDSNRKTSLKQLMKDNRAIETKPNKQEQEEYKTALQKLEEEYGKLERLGRSGISRSKQDSYTGTPICFLDQGGGLCNGQRSVRGFLSKDCKECPYLKGE